MAKGFGPAGSIGGPGAIAVASRAGGGRGVSFGKNAAIRVGGPEGGRVAFLNPSDSVIKKNFFTSVKPLGVVPIRISGNSEDGKAGVGTPFFREFTPGQISQLKTTGERRNPSKGSARFDIRNFRPINSQDKRNSDPLRRSGVIFFRPAETAVITIQAPEKKPASRFEKPRLLRPENITLFKGLAGREIRTAPEIQAVNVNPGLQRVRRLRLIRGVATQEQVKSGNMVQAQVEPAKKADAASRIVTGVKVAVAQDNRTERVIRSRRVEIEKAKRKKREELVTERKVVIDDDLNLARIRAMDARRRKKQAEDPEGIVTLREVVGVLMVPDGRAHRSRILEGTEYKDGGLIRMSYDAFKNQEPATEENIAALANEHLPVKEGEGGRQATRGQLIEVVTLPEDPGEPVIDTAVYFEPQKEVKIIDELTEVTGPVVDQPVSPVEESDNRPVVFGAKRELLDTEDNLIEFPFGLKGSLRLDRRLYISNEEIEEEALYAA